MPDLVTVLGYILLWAGFIFLMLLLLLGIWVLLYGLYDRMLKKLLGWKEAKLRRDLFYFIRNKERIRKIVKKEIEEDV